MLPEIYTSKYGGAGYYIRVFYLDFIITGHEIYVNMRGRSNGQSICVTAHDVYTQFILQDRFIAVEDFSAILPIAVSRALHACYVYRPTDTRIWDQVRNDEIASSVQMTLDGFIY